MTDHYATHEQWLALVARLKQNKARRKGAMSETSERKTPWTPGPWATGMSRGETNAGPCLIYSEGKSTGYICSLPPKHENLAANAALITEAPAMVDVIGALMESVKALDEDYDQRHSYQSGAALMARLGAP